MGRRINEKNAKKHKVNICGEWIKYVRTGHYDKYHPKISQDTLITRLQTRGLMMKRSSLSRIETGCRALTDLEVVYFAEALRVPVTFLYEGTNKQMPKTEDLSSMVAERDEKELE